ncbi:single-stranded-DNA-specific exonuclease RecJ [Crassaminicella thermophila]|uniref:Single-stranded-DNA-specific exonuclease RecJ n=1 Tax=Crassaminicella thermophila TaxID=2599308 RepID=A0A5C0SC38_CRATE|nr:single-stranded-DNA-specific exonuclease RecJ [Crassaminicella thermophila]QEK11497.1 single-stranded-DNA-specific exonuclease RecJ [Crassaminicella thermophila]
MFETNWEIINEDKDIDDTDSIIKKILRNKGITSDEEIEEFLSSKPKKTYDPYLLKNMREVVEKIIKYINEKKSIWIYGDYDVDGISSISLLMDFLSKFTNNLNYYIPLREEEGYGLNCDAIEDIKKKGGELIITVDCGSTSVKEVNLAKELGMEIIVTDHHNLSDEVPNCLILNPKQEDCHYPFKLLCGCGIAFKLAQAIQKRLDAPKKYLSDVLDLVALATVADVVPLIDENRTLLKYGLKKINNSKRLGLKALIEAVGLRDKEITAGHIGFVIGPHFNASGRIDDAKASVKLLLSNDAKIVESLVKHLVKCNKERKAIQEKGLEICKEKVEKYYLEDLFLVVDSEGTHEGVIGIVAGRIRDLYYKPTLIVTQSQEEGILKGSGRSIDDIDIYEEMKKCEDLFIKFGGHKNACGFSIEKSKLDLLRKRLNEQALMIKQKSKDAFIKKLRIDCELKPSQITEELIEALKKIEPYGMGNEKPQFILRQIKVKNEKDSVFMGKNGEHLKLRGVSKFYDDLTEITAIGFGMAKNYKDIGYPQNVDVVGFPKLNEWNGYKNVQFMIYDLKEKGI